MTTKIQILMLLIVCTVSTAQNRTSASDSLSGFNGFRWGSSSEFIRSNEKSEYLQTSIALNKTVLSFTAVLENWKTRIDYVFEGNKLIEGSYTFDDFEDVKSLFYSMRNYINKDYGDPDFWAVNQIDSDKIWTMVNNYGLFRGPELYWQFENGFIALLSSKYEEDITLTVLYVYNKSIKKYSEDIFMPVELFSIE